MIGTYISNELFSGTSPIGKTIKIKGEIFSVIGVLEEKSTSSAGTDDDRIIIPYTAAKRLLKNSNITSFYVQAKSEEVVDIAMTELEALLYDKFKDDSLYRVFNQSQMLDTVSATTKTLTMLLGESQQFLYWSEELEL